MRLLLFMHSLGGGGAERVAVTLVNRWAEMGWEVSLATLASAEHDRYQLHPEIHRVALDLAGESTGPVGAIMANARRILALRRLLRRERPDVAVAMMTIAGVLLAVAGTGLRISLIGSERTYPPSQPLPRVWKLLRAWAYGHLSVVVAPTEGIRRWLLKHTAARHVEVIPNPIVWPLPVQSPVESPAGVGRPGNKRLLAVGRLAVEKRYDVLIEIFAGLAPRFPDWDLVIVGEGPERHRLERQIDVLGLGSRVALPGYVGNLGEWYGSADLYALTSSREGFPNTLLEALAYGVPAVSVDCETGPRDILRPEVDGMLVPPQDNAALSSALARLMGDSCAREAFAIHAVEAGTRFALEQVGARWDQVLHRLRR